MRLLRIRLEDPRVPEPLQEQPSAAGRRLSAFISAPQDKLRGIAFALPLLFAVAALDYFTGTEVSFSIFYLLPVVIASWLGGALVGLGTALVCAVIWFLNDAVLGGSVYSSPAVPYWNALTRFGFFMIVAGMLIKLRQMFMALEHQTQRTQVAYTDLNRVRVEQLRLKDEVLSHVSHELRTPLTAAHQFITILGDGLAGTLEPEQQEYLLIALRNVEQLNRMIGDLLDATHMEAEKLKIRPERVDILPIVQEIVRSLRSPAAEKNLEITTAIQPDLPTVWADPTRLRQVLHNLLHNAVKYASSGEVRVSAQLTDERPGFVKLGVSDTGPGIPADRQAQLFQRLYQVEGSSDDSRKGLGLGLFICKHIVNRHGGAIWVESEPGRGASFYFTLPIDSATIARHGSMV